MLEFFSFSQPTATPLPPVRTFTCTRSRSASGSVAVHYCISLSTKSCCLESAKKVCRIFLGIRKNHGAYTHIHMDAMLRDFFYLYHPDHHHHLHTYMIFYLCLRTSTADFLCWLFLENFPCSLFSPLIVLSAASHFSRLVKVGPQRFLTVFCIYPVINFSLFIITFTKTTTKKLNNKKINKDRQKIFR